MKILSLTSDGSTTTAAGLPVNGSLGTQNASTSAKGKEDIVRECFFSAVDINSKYKYSMNEILCMLANDILYTL